MNKKLLMALVTIIGVSVSVNIFLGITNFQDQNQINDLKTEREALKTEISTLITERDNARAEAESLMGQNNVVVASNSALLTERDTLKGEVYSLNNQKDDAVSCVEDLNGEIEQLRAGRVMSKLGLYDNRDNAMQPYIHVYGFVWNVGTEAVFDCKIHVVGKQGDVVAVDTYIELGTLTGYVINPQTSIEEIDERVYYTGSKLTDTRVTIEYD